MYSEMYCTCTTDVDRAFNLLFKSWSYQKRRDIILRRINRNLENNGLHNLETWDITTEAYLRSRAAIQKGKTIWNYPAWVESASMLIIKEIRRKRSSIAESSIGWGILYAPDLPEELSRELDHESIQQALNILNSTEKRIIDLRFFLEYPWDSVQRILEADGYPPRSLNTLRQINFRAIQKLKRNIACNGKTL